MLTLIARRSRHYAGTRFVLLTLIMYLFLFDGDLYL